MAWIDVKRLARCLVEKRKKRAREVACLPPESGTTMCIQCPVASLNGWSFRFSCAESIIDLVADWVPVREMASCSLTCGLMNRSSEGERSSPSGIFFIGPFNPSELGPVGVSVVSAAGFDGVPCSNPIPLVWSLKSCPVLGDVLVNFSLMCDHFLMRCIAPTKRLISWVRVQSGPPP